MVAGRCTQTPEMSSESGIVVSSAKADGTIQTVVAKSARRRAMFNMVSPCCEGAAPTARGVLPKHFRMAWFLDIA